MTGVEILSFTTGGATTLESSFMDGSSYVLSGNSAAGDVTIDMDSANLNASGLTSDSTIGITNTVGNIAGIALTLTGSNYNDVLAGDNVADAITGGDGDDTIDAGAGADQVTGGAGIDDIDGDAGADVIDGGAGGDTLDGGDGIDTITTGAGADTVTFNTQTSLANALAARDTVTDFTAGASGDTYDYDGATANVTQVVGSSANSVQTHSATGNLTITAAAEVVNITVEDVATLTTDGEAVLNALVSGTGNSGTITTANAGEVKLITISDGTSTGVYIGAPGAGNTDIAQAEMALIATFTGVDNADLVAGNFAIA
jgi:Ca2+-binding RTX toxin-like protein